MFNIPWIVHSWNCRRKTDALLVVYTLQQPVTNLCLVAGIPTPLKHMKVSWDNHSQYMEKYGKITFMFQTTSQIKMAYSWFTHSKWWSNPVRYVADKTRGYTLPSSESSEPGASTFCWGAEEIGTPGTKKFTLQVQQSRGSVAQLARHGEPEAEGHGKRPGHVAWS